VEIIGALVVPTFCAGKVRFVGESMTPVRPFPVRLTVCGLPVALSETVRVPVKVPVAVGLKVTEIRQFFPAFTVVPQVFVWL
jgi:hypothetical protein